jgi:hypothetical protein
MLRGPEFVEKSLLLSCGVQGHYRRKIQAVELYLLSSSDSLILNRTLKNKFVYLWPVAIIWVLSQSAQRAAFRNENESPRRPFSSQ